MGRYEYTVMTTATLVSLISTDIGIWGNQKLSTYETTGVEEYARTKSAWVTPLLNINEEQKTTQRWSLVRTGQLLMLRATAIAIQFTSHKIALRQVV